MTIKLPEVDAVMVGMGWSGSIMALELAKAGLDVVGLERGPDIDQAERFSMPYIRDELRFSRRLELAQDPAMETLSFRHGPADTALPMRRLGSFLPGDGVGGAANMWGGHTWRNLPNDHRLRSHLTQRYGAKAIPDDMSITDWPVSYEELETHYDAFEKLCGVAGQAGNVRGRKIAGGNPFEGERSDDFPTPPLAPSLSSLMFADAARELGYSPFPRPVGNVSRPYVNREGVALGACKLCGFCDRNGCEANAKANPLTCVMPKLRIMPNFELRARAWVSRLNYDSKAKRVTGVVYVDTRTGQEYEQPAGVVVLSAFVFGNVSLMLHSGIGQPYDPATGKGAVGKNYCYQLSRFGIDLFFKDKYFNPFMGAPGTQMAIDDFNADNFDHEGLGFLGGAIITCGHGNGRPIGYRPVPPGTPKWGAEWKRAATKWYQHAMTISLSGSNYAHRNNYLDLDPTYRDQLGRPLLRMTYNFVENDHRISEYCMGKAVEIAKAMNPTIMADPRIRRGDYDIAPYQSTHNAGGTIMGTDPKTSVVNRYMQAWDAHNLFIMGASTFPQQVATNPTGPLGALTYWAAEAIKTSYVKAPGPLVQA